MTRRFSWIKHESGTSVDADVVIASMMILVSAVVLWQVVHIAIPESRMMPLLVLFLTGSSGVSLLIKSLKKKEFTSATTLLLSKKHLLVILMLFVNALVIPIIGFYSSAFLLVVGISMVIEDHIGKKQFAVILLRSLILCATIYIMFSIMLRMYLPGGIAI